MGTEPYTTRQTRKPALFASCAETAITSPIAARTAAAPKYATITRWCDEISGMSRTVTYEELGRGNLRAIKVGARTLVDVEHGLAWLASRPAAQIAAPRSAA